MKLPELIGGIPQVCPGFLGVVFRSVAGPSHEVVQSSPDHSRVKDVVDFVVVLTVYLIGRGSVGVLSQEGVWVMLFEETDVEHGV